jgi:hypothetical protein
MPLHLFQCSNVRHHVALGHNVRKAATLAGEMIANTREKSVENVTKVEKCTNLSVLFHIQPSGYFIFVDFVYAAH